MSQRKCKNTFLKFESIVNNRQICNTSILVHKLTIYHFFLELLLIWRLLTRLHYGLLNSQWVGNHIVKTGTKFYSHLPVDFEHWGFLFGTHIWLVSNVLKPKILVMTCQQPLVKQARVECSHWRLLAETAVWLTVGREVTVALLQGHYANVIMYKKMRHEQAILLVSILKQTADYFFY